MMKLTSINLEKTTVPVLAVPVWEDDNLHAMPVSALVEGAKAREEFKSAKEEELILYDLPGTQVKRALFFGLGKVKDLDAERLRSFAGKAAKACVKKGFKNLLIAAPEGENLPLQTDIVFEALLEGAFMGNHIFDRYKAKQENKPLRRISLLCSRAGRERCKNLPLRVETICQGTLAARNWVNTPSNDKTPPLLAGLFSDAAADTGLKVTVLSEKELKRKKFGALLAVAAGSSNKPRLVMMEYRVKKTAPTVALVGKGVTFDSGGINLKPTDGIADMKSDMSGAAAVAAALVAVSNLKPDVNVVGLMPLVENMPSGDATRPGDIVKSYSGKTIEIGNTDAEGRLILIDAMSYALETYKPEVMVDAATLTGACVIALGERIAGVFSPDDVLADAIVAAGLKTHERCWRMPLPEDYRELLKSELADLNNVSSGRWGGAVTAALFLSEFSKDVRWAHLDIAGPAYIKKPHDYCAAGATGFGVRLFCELIKDLEKTLPPKAS